MYPYKGEEMIIVNQSCLPGYCAEVIDGRYLSNWKNMGA
jgi:hypothetical protein